MNGLTLLSYLSLPGMGLTPDECDGTHDKKDMDAVDKKDMDAVDKQCKSLVRHLTLNGA
jgi:hypothetical protein